MATPTVMSNLDSRSKVFWEVGSDLPVRSIKIYMDMMETAVAVSLYSSFSCTMRTSCLVRSMLIQWYNNEAPF